MHTICWRDRRGSRRGVNRFGDIKDVEGHRGDHEEGGANKREREGECIFGR